MDNVVQLASNREAHLPIESKDVIRWMKDLRDQRLELKEEEERAKEYLAQCKAEVEQDLEPRRKAVEKLEEMLIIFLNEENGGEKYRVPGLGTVFTTHRTTPKIVDEDALAEAIEKRNPLKYSTITRTVIDRQKAQKYAKEILEEGEVLPGIEVTETESLSFRQ